MRGGYRVEYGRTVESLALDPPERSLTMLWTILVILAIIALVLFILNSVRGRRGI